MPFNHTNELKQKLEDGQMAFGAFCINNDPVEVELLGQLGLDWVWIDTEHINGCPYEADELSGVARAADLTGMEILCRVPTNAPHMVRKVLDTGIRNITVPRIQTAADIEKIARTAVFKYVEDQDFDHGFEATPDDRGTRGASRARATEHGGMGGAVSDVNDENVMVGAVIEDYEAIRNIDEIFEVPGVGYTMFGPYCMSISIGEPGSWDHPKIEEAVEIFVEAAEDHDIPIVQSVSGLHRAHGKVDYDELLPAKEAIQKGPPFQMYRLESANSLIRRAISEQLDTLQDYADEYVSGN